LGAPEPICVGQAHEIESCIWRFGFKGIPLLFLRKLAFRTLLFEPLHLAILHDKFERRTRELRCPEYQALHLNQRNYRLARQ